MPCYRAPYLASLKPVGSFYNRYEPLIRPNMSDATTYFRDLTVGETARVVSFHQLHKTYRNRLMSLGLTPGTEFKIQHLAPLGDPVDISVRGFHLSLRWAEAGDMEVSR